MNGSPHLPLNIRQWYGDSRGHWEGNTLVIDVTNFSPKTDYHGSRENLHVVEHWTRTGPTSLEYVVTIEDPTVWTRPWSVKQDFTRQSDQENRVYYELRCVEGNYGLPGMLHGRRMEERAVAEGRGPNARRGCGSTSPPARSRACIVGWRGRQWLRGRRVVVCAELRASFMARLASRP
jgi:hypothetical protein